MEKKTIGKFISVLRKANGMTQRELAEKLFVSDKTVSRWECDECAPDLVLIPAIAELFGITADELLRGERCSASLNNDMETTKNNIKRDKQFKTMLYNRMVKYKNLTLISVGLIALALVSAMIFNLGFLKGVVGCCVASVFLIASVICQISFSASFKIPFNEDEEYYDKEIKQANSDIVKKELSVVLWAVTVFAFILPIALVGSSYAGLEFGSWLTFGITFALIAYALGHIVYVFGIRKKLINKEILFCDEREKAKNVYQSKLLKKTLTVAICLAAVLLVGLLVLNSVGVSAFAKKVVFTDDDGWVEFKKFMRNGRSYSDSESSFFVDVYEEPVHGVEEDSSAEYPIEYLFDKEGNACIPFECRERFYISIEYNEFNEDGTPAQIAVYTRQANANARRIFDFLSAVLCISILVESITCAVVYGVKMSKYR